MSRPVDRIVLLSLIPELAHPEGRAQVAAEARRVLPEVPGVIDVRIGVAEPADEPPTADGPRPNAWDVSMLIRIASADALPAYQADPAHRAFVDGYLAPRVAFRKAWNFTSTD